MGDPGFVEGGLPKTVPFRGGGGYAGVESWSMFSWMNNHLMTDPKGNSEFCFPETLKNAKKKSFA